MTNFKNRRPKELLVEKDDISAVFTNLIYEAREVAWDIETSGLNWDSDQIGTCQLYVPQDIVTIVKVGSAMPEKMRTILSDEGVKKVFHHALFDLRFMCYHWKVSARNIACTKIAAKLLYKSNSKYHKLKPLLNKYLNVKIDKSQTLSNWLSNDLSDEQVVYAVEDVIYLFDLLKALEKELNSKGLLELVYRSYSHIPTRVDLDILRYSDLYTY
jgi:ribonuclease D